MIHSIDLNIYKTYKYNLDLSKSCNDADELDVVLDQLLERPPDQSNILELEDEETVNPSLTGNGKWVTRLLQFAGKPSMNMEHYMPNS